MAKPHQRQRRISGGSRSSDDHRGSRSTKTNQRQSRTGTGACFGHRGRVQDTGHIEERATGARRLAAQRPNGSDR